MLSGLRLVSEVNSLSQSKVNAAPFSYAFLVRGSILCGLGFAGVAEPYGDNSGTLFFADAGPLSNTYEHQSCGKPKRLLILSNRKLHGPVSAFAARGSLRIIIHLYLREVNRNVLGETIFAARTTGANRRNETVGHRNLEVINRGFAACLTNRKHGLGNVRPVKTS